MSWWYFVENAANGKGHSNEAVVNMEDKTPRVCVQVLQLHIFLVIMVKLYDPLSKLTSKACLWVTLLYTEIMVKFGSMCLVICPLLVCDWILKCFVANYLYILNTTQEADGHMIGHMGGHVTEGEVGPHQC